MFCLIMYRLYLLNKLISLKKEQYVPFFNVAVQLTTYTSVQCTMRYLPSEQHTVKFSIHKFSL